MGLEHIAGQLNADASRIVQHATWGHLFPKYKNYFRGRIRIALSVYGDVIILDEDIDIPSSPWWYIVITKFAGEVVEKLKEGEVYDISIAVTIVDHEFFYEPWECEGDDDVDITKPYKIESEFVITELKRTQLISGY